MAFRNVISLWPSRTALARDVQEDVSTIRKWYRRNRIPVEHWAKLLEAARVRELPITADYLTRIADQRRAADSSRPVSA